MSGVGTWRVVLDTGAVHAIEARGVVLFAGKREWQKATFGEAVWGSFDGPLEAVTGLAKSLRWNVLEYVPPGALTREEAVAAAVANVRAQYEAGVAETEREFAKRAAACGVLAEAIKNVDDGIIGRLVGKSVAYTHAIDVLRAEMGAAMRGSGT